LKRESCGRQSKILFILAMLIFSIFISTNAAAAEEIQAGDLIAPMKMEIEMGTDNEIITKTIYVKNTGNTPTSYVFYTEQAGGKNEISSKFKLSETETKIDPRETFELSLTVSKKELEEYGSKDLENVKIKMIRNPESQMPVGYIIPVEINHFNEKTNEETAGNKTNGSVSAGTNSISEKPAAGSDDIKIEENQTKEENKEKKNENSGNNISEKNENSEVNENGNQNRNRTARIIIAVGMLSTFAVLIGGLHLNQKRKK